MSIEDSSKLTKLLNKGFKRPIYWNKYKVTPNKEADSSCQSFKRLFVLEYNNTAGNNQVSVDSYKKILFTKS